MIPHQVLRRETFGGMLVAMPDARFTVLDADGYRRVRNQLADASLTARIVDVTAWGYPLLPDALSSPGTAYLELTKRCEGACTHCYAAVSPPGLNKELAFGEIERLLQQLAACGAYYIRLTGGEPTLRNDLSDILDVIAGTGMKAAVNTHGRYGESRLRRLLERGVQDLRISLDGTEPVHDAIRGRGSYQTVLATLRRIADYNQSAHPPADPTINVVLMRANRHCVTPLIDLAAKLGFKLSFGLLRPVGKAETAEMLSPEEVAGAAWEVAQRRRELSLAEGSVRINFDVFCETNSRAPANPFPLDNSKCPIGINGIGVSAEGRVMPCNFMGSIKGGQWLGESICDRDILDLWHHSPVIREARRVKRGGCGGCPHYRTKCNGGCPATALVWTDSLDGRDPYCVRGVT